MDLNDDTKFPMDAIDGKLRKVISNVIDEGILNPKQVADELNVTVQRVHQICDPGTQTAIGGQSMKGMMRSAYQDLSIGACDILAPQLIHGPRNTQYKLDTDGDGELTSVDSQTIVARIQTELGELAIATASLMGRLKNGNELKPGESLVVNKEVRDVKHHCNGLMLLVAEWEKNGDGRHTLGRVGS